MQHFYRNRKSEIVTSAIFKHIRSTQVVKRHFATLPAKNIQFFERHGWKTCLQLLENAEDEGYEPNLKLYNEIIRKCANERRSEPALYVYNRLLRQNLKPDASTMSFVIQGCARAGDMDSALEFMQSYESSGLSLDVGAFESCLQELSTGGMKDRFPVALNLAQTMFVHFLSPSTGCYEALINLCVDANDIKSASNFFKQAKDNNLLSPRAYAAYAQCIQNSQELWSFLNDVSQDIPIEPVVLNGVFKALLSVDPSSIVEKWDSFKVEDFDASTWLSIIEAYHQTKQIVSPEFFHMMKSCSALTSELLLTTAEYAQDLSLESLQEDVWSEFLHSNEVVSRATEHGCNVVGLPLHAGKKLLEEALKRRSAFRRGAVEAEWFRLEVEPDKQMEFIRALDAYRPPVKAQPHKRLPNVVVVNEYSLMMWKAGIDFDEMLDL